MGRTVVIVDDHEQFRRSARKLLELEGFDVIGEAANGSDGIAEVERLRPALALVDVVLPDISGFEVAERVAAATAVILVSSRGRGEVGRRLERSSALGFVPKDRLSGSALGEILDAPR
jgi:DNA-binding NarL/FixJ family response regulator